MNEMSARTNPLAGISLTRTPQGQPMPGVKNQVRNAAGGYVFGKDLWTRVEDFLILGTTGGTFYTAEAQLTAQNLAVLLEARDTDPERFVTLAREISDSRPSRAPKPDPCIFALALAASDAKARPYAKAAFADVIRTTDHLAKFFGYCKNIAGKDSKAGHGTSLVSGRAMRTMLASFFNGRDVHDAAFAALKGRQRKTPSGEDMALRDIIRLSHAAGRTAEHTALIGWLAGKVSDEQAREILPDVDNFLAAQAAVTKDEALALILERRVPWEFIPSELRTAKVWRALADTVGMTALIRNLGLMTRLGTIKPFADVNDRVVARLTSQDGLVRARVHPVDLYLALKAYQSGRSQPHPKAAVQTWQPVGVITDALEQAYGLSFGAVEPSGKKLLVAVDSSGSMAGNGWWAPGGNMVTVNGTEIGTPYEVANTMAAMLARTEGGNVHVIDVDTSVHASKVTPKTSFRDIARWRPSGGGTDLSLPFSWARTQNMKVDGIVVLTDSETWAGHAHAQQELQRYRRAVNPDVRVVVVSMTAAGYQIVDPGDEAVLSVAGLDAALPKVISGFIR
jgi:60 kDa SS-A/Ro ribonucleoprotein